MVCLSKNIPFHMSIISGFIVWTTGAVAHQMFFRWVIKGPFHILPIYGGRARTSYNTYFILVRIILPEIIFCECIFSSPHKSQNLQSGIVNQWGLGSDREEEIHAETRRAWRGKSARAWEHESVRKDIFPRFFRSKLKKWTQGHRVIRSLGDSRERDRSNCIEIPRLKKIAWEPRKTRKTIYDWRLPI